MTKVNLNNGNETKSDISSHWSQNTKYFIDFYDWHLSILMQTK